MAGCRVGVLSDDEDPDRVEGLLERTQHVLRRREEATPRPDLRPQERAELRHGRLDRGQRLGPRRVHELEHGAAGHAVTLATLDAPMAGCR